MVLDNLSRGHRELVLDAELVVGDLADSILVRRTLADHRVSAVMHFAAYASVGESAVQPLTYYANNVGGTISLLRAMVESDVKRLVFSSTCATYGLPETMPSRRTIPSGRSTPTAPAS